MDSVNVSEKVTRKHIFGCLSDRIFLDHMNSQKREEIFSPMTAVEGTHPGGGSGLEGRRGMKVGREGVVGGVGNKKLDGKIKDLIRSVDICYIELIIKAPFAEKKERN